MARISQPWRAPPHPCFALGGGLEEQGEPGPRTWVRVLPLSVASSRQ